MTELFLWLNQSAQTPQVLWCLHWCFVGVGDDTIFDIVFPDTFHAWRNALFDQLCYVRVVSFLSVKLVVLSWFRYVFQILSAGSRGLHLKTVLVSVISSAWHYQFFRINSGAVGHLWGSMIFICFIEVLSSVWCYKHLIMWLANYIHFQDF